MIEKYAFIQIMKTVLTRPAKRFSVREAARAAGLSPYAAKYSLDYMLETGMVKLDKVGRSYQYHADNENPLTRQWKVLFTLEELGGSGIVGKVKTANGVLSVLLYGSTATGRDDENSDIDIIVIADTDQKGKRDIMAMAHGTKREVNITVYTPYEWKKKAETDKIFYEHAIIDSIPLYGEKPVVL